MGAFTSPATCATHCEHSTSCGGVPLTPCTRISTILAGLGLDTNPLELAPAAGAPLSLLVMPAPPGAQPAVPAAPPPAGKAAACPKRGASIPLRYRRARSAGGLAGVQVAEQGELQPGGPVQPGVQRVPRRPGGPGQHRRAAVRGRLRRGGAVPDAERHPD